MIQATVFYGLLALCFYQAPDAPKEPQPSSEPKAVAESSVSDEGVLLQFRDQEWLPALTWLAGKLELNLDWQKLPEDRLSLSSSQEITLAEAEDLFNMQLLARGFILLKRDGVLRLTPLENLDITLVPRVEPEQLAELPKHSIARVSFPLEWMIADEAAKELQPLLSPYGKLSAMPSSNRIEVVDAVVNLREFYKLLLDSEKDDARRERVAEFHLVHRKADEVAIKVRQLLGLPPEGTPTPHSQTQLDIEQARFKVEAVKQMGRAAQDLVTEKKPTIYLVVNEKENSLLINAPPNKIEIARQAVKALDKPQQDQESAWETISRVKVYDVAGFDPEAVSKMIAAMQDRGSVAKDVRIQHEAAYNRLIVFASPNDQLTIAQLIESFRAEKRSAMVLPLANIEPVYAAKAIQLVLKTPERPSASPGVPSDGKFQIEADPQHHRLLLWANPAEVREVREFLARLGETFADQPIDSKMHVIEFRGNDVDELVDRLQKIWKEISDSPLLFEPAENQRTEATKRDTSDNVSEKAPFAHTVSATNERYVAQTKGADAAAIDTSSATDSKSSPVRVLQNAQGDLIVLSRDPVAAETAKRLIQQMTKEANDLRVIALQHSQASVVKRQLDTILLQSFASSSSKLASSPTVVIDIDQRTNRLIVQNASDRQWSQIQESVELLDQPAQDEKKLIREKGTYRFKHRKASVVAEAVKGIYQDLLSINEKSITNSTTRSTAFNQNLAATASNPEYQGLLSLAVDHEANMLIISAPRYLIEDVLKLVESMDTPVDGTAIAIIPADDLPMARDGRDSKASENLKKILQERRR